MTTVVPQRTKAPSRFHPGGVALRDTWLPLVHTLHVGRRPVRRAMHGAPVILWRDGARVRATEDMPGTPAQRQRRGELTGGTGDYISHERYGYTWVWYGDPRNASPDLIPHVPHMPIDGMPKWFQKSLTFDCSYELVAENLLDLTHADFLHSKITGDSLSEDDIVEVESTSEVVTMIRTAHGRPMPDAQKAMARGAKTQNIRVVTVTHVRSGVCVLHGDFNPGMSMRMLHPCNPETPTRTRTPVTYNPAHMPALGRLMFPYATRVSAGRTTGRCASRTRTTSTRETTATSVPGSTRRVCAIARSTPHSSYASSPATTRISTTEIRAATSPKCSASTPARETH